MSNIFFKILLISVSFYFLLGSCSEKEEKSNIKIKNLYIETVGFTPELKLCFDDYFFGQRKRDTLWVLPDTVICQYKDADILPDNNLKDYTKKMRVTLLKKDSIGNPPFQIEVFHSEGSKWKRSSNSGSNPMCRDSLMTLEQLCSTITRSTYIYILKFNP